MELSSQFNPFILYTIGVCFLAHIIFKVSQLFVSRHRQAVALKDFPGPPRHWLYGNLKEVRENPDRALELTREWTRKFPKALRFWLGPFRAGVRLHHPDYIRCVMSGADPKDPLYRFMEPWIGDGLLLSKGRKWARNRRLLTPAFHFDILKAYVKLFNESSAVLLNKWQGLCGKGTASLEMFEHMSLLTLDNILKCAFSYRSECQLEIKQNEYITSVFAVASLVMERLRYPLYHYEWIYYLSPSGRRFRKFLHILHSFSENVIAARKEALKASQTENDRVQKKKYLDFLDILLKARDEDGVGMSDEEIQHEVDTFMFEGHDTTASGLSWFFYNMANHPEIQERCREEINDVLGDDSEVKWEHLPRFEYLSKCIKESLRVHPPVPTVSRMVEKDTPLPDGRFIPAGTWVIMSAYAIHHNAEVWENPSDYDPSRFDKENCEGRSPYAFIPFSAGPRNCIGQNFAMMEMKVSAAQMLRKFKFQINRSIPSVIPKPELILRTKEGLKLNVTAL